MRFQRITRARCSVWGRITCGYGLIMPPITRTSRCIYRNDKSLFVYNGLDKTVIEYKPGQWLYAGVTDNPFFDVLSGAIAKDLQDRFELKLFREDEFYSTSTSSLSSARTGRTSSNSDWRCMGQRPSSRTCRRRFTSSSQMARPSSGGSPSR